MAAGDLAFTGGVYTNFKAEVMKGTFNLLGGTDEKIMLMVGHTADPTHSTVTNVKTSGTELAVSGYTARGAVVPATKSVATTGTAGMFDSTGDVTWASLAVATISHAILYMDTGTDGTSLVIAAWTLAGAPSTGGDYKLVFGANGILRIT